MAWRRFGYWNLSYNKKPIAPSPFRKDSEWQHGLVMERIVWGVQNTLL